MGNAEQRAETKKAPFMGSWMTLNLLTVILIILGLCLINAFPFMQDVSDERLDAFLRETAREWKEKYGDNSRLQAALIDVRFRKDPGLFVEGESVIVAPVGIDLHGVQEILDVKTYPPHLRKIKTEGITCIAWEYAGAVNKDIRCAALVLVKRPETRADRKAATLPSDLKEDALVTALELEEHGLDQCADFTSWVEEVAGEPPHKDQILRIVEAVGERIVPRDKSKRPEDICASLRDGVFTAHRAHVLTVMAARQLKIPSFGFASASPRQVFLAGFYSEGEGWLFVDIENPAKGFLEETPVLITKTPIIGGFEGCHHSFWYPEAASYQKDGWGGLGTLSATSWRGRLKNPNEETDTTEARTFTLGELGS